MSFFQKFDIFGVPITIRFNYSDTHKTKLGALVTIVIVGILVYQIFYQLVELFNYSNVSIIFQEEIVDTPKKYSIQPQTFNLAFGLLTDDLQIINDSKIMHFEPVFQQTDKVFNTTSNQFEFITKEYPIEMVQCTLQHFQTEDISYFKTLPLQNLYCFDLNAKLELEGQFGAKIYKRIRIRVKECLESNCKDSSIRNKILDNSQLIVFYFNYALQVTNLTQPFQQFGQTNFWKNSNTTLKNINLYFRNVYVDSTQGLFAQNLVRHNRLTFSYDREQVIQKYDNTVYEVFVNLEKNRESHYYRKYITLIQSLSQIGGLFNFLICIGAIFMRPISRIIYKQQLLNQIFSFKKVGITSEKTQVTQQFPLLSTSPKVNCFKSKQKLSNQENLNNTLGKLEKQLNVSQLNQSIINSSFKQNDKKKQKRILSNKEIIKLKQCKEKQLFSFQEKIIEGKTPQAKNYINGQSPNNNQPSEQISNQKSSQEKSLFTKQINDQSINESISNKINNMFFSKSLSNKQRKEYENYLNQQFNMTDNQFYVSFCDVMKCHLSSFLSLIPKWKTSKKSRMIEYGLQKLDQHLEINYIIGKLIEVDKLKKLLLSNEQLSLFNLVPKPQMEEYYFKKSKEKNSDLQKTHFFYAENKSLQEKIIDAQDAFNKLMKENDGQISSYTKKLLQLLDPKLLQFLEQVSFSQKLKQEDCIQVNLKSQLEEQDQQQQLQKERQTQMLITQDIINDEYYSREDMKHPNIFQASSNNVFQIDTDSRF